jgi:hypothetical protein
MPSELGFTAWFSAWNQTAGGGYRNENYSAERKTLPIRRATFDR